MQYLQPFSIQSYVQGKYKIEIEAPRQQILRFINQDQYQEGLMWEIITAGSYYDALTAACEFCRQNKITPSFIKATKQ